MVYTSGIDVYVYKWESVQKKFFCGFNMFQKLETLTQENQNPHM